MDRLADIVEVLKIQNEVTALEEVAKELCALCDNADNARALCDKEELLGWLVRVIKKNAKEFLMAGVHALRTLVDITYHRGVEVKNGVLAFPRLIDAVLRVVGVMGRITRRGNGGW